MSHPDPTPLALHYEFAIHATLSPNLNVGVGPYGARSVAAVLDGTVTGDRLNGMFHGPGADWVLVGRDGYARLDVRGQLLTDDEVVIYVQYDGLLELNDAVVAALGDPTKETSWDDQYFRTSPRFETGAAQYAWLQQSVFVARGRIATDGVEYEVYRVG